MTKRPRARQARVSGVAPIEPAVLEVQLAVTAFISSRNANRLRAIVAEHNGFVTRTLQLAGVPLSDLDDEVQRTFIIVADRLDDVQVGAERSFLYRVALNTAAHLRRTKARRREVTDGQVPDVIESCATPEHLMSRKETAQLLDEAAASMGEALYQVFKLFAYEDANLAEIARRLGIPRGTVASRLRRARAHFRSHPAVLELASSLESGRPEQIEEPKTMSRVKTSRLMKCLLQAGAFPRATASVRSEILAVLGLARRPKQRSGGTTNARPMRRTRRQSGREHAGTLTTALSRSSP